jgi:superfamily I DNA/RNA helicase
MTMERIWSAEQNAIFEWFRFSTVNGSACKNLIVRARAGSGKTTTILEAIKFAPESAILTAAFNKSIADELTRRLSNPNAVAKTLHGVGFACLLRYWNGMRPCSGSERADRLAARVCGSQVPDPIIRLVSKLHSKGREIAPHARAVGDLTSLAIQFECAPDESWEAEGFDLEFVERKALEAMELAATVKPVDGMIDFADMIFLPVRNRWMVKKYGLVVVDEAQDMTNAQLELAMGVCSGRVCVVGDDRQAIYGFRGADSDSIDRLKAQLDACELGLKTTYRCGRAIVEEAAKLVPDFRAGDDNPEGLIDTLHVEKLQEAVINGDFILSRVNAPLVSIAMRLLRNGKRARIAGRDIGRSLVTLTRKLAKGRAAESVPAFIDRVGAWRDKETQRLTPQLLRESTMHSAKAKFDALMDQADTLVNIAEGAASVSEVITRIEHLFTDDGLGAAGVITCSSVHRSKGLEANHVFVLAKTLRGGNREEENIKYVAVTRAKQTLTWVTE